MSLQPRALLERVGAGRAEYLQVIWVQNCVLKSMPRTVLLVLACNAMGAAWMIEQPRSSILPWHPRMRLLFKLCPKVREATVYVGSLSFVH